VLPGMQMLPDLECSGHYNITISDLKTSFCVFHDAACRMLYGSTKHYIAMFHFQKSVSCMLHMVWFVSR